MASVTWQTELRTKLLREANFYKENSNISIEVAIKEIAKIFITSRELTLKRYTSLDLLSIRRLNPGEALDVELLKQRYSKLEDAMIKEEEDFVLVDDLRERSRKELKLLRAWEKDPSACLKM